MEQMQFVCIFPMFSVEPVGGAVPLQGKIRRWHGSYRLSNDFAKRNMVRICGRGVFTNALSEISGIAMSVWNTFMRIRCDCCQMNYLKNNQGAGEETVNRRRRCRFSAWNAEMSGALLIFKWLYGNSMDEPLSLSILFWIEWDSGSFIAGLLIDLFFQEYSLWKCCKDQQGGSVYRLEDHDNLVHNENTAAV